MDTIVAVASARGKGGVAVLRISGDRAWDVCRQLTGGVPPERKAVLRVLRDSDGAVLDQALVLIFEQGRSFTGERVCELHVHGGSAVVSAVLEAITSIDGVRTAEAGEFTRRAFINGRMDLVEVEALADLIDAETEMQRKRALIAGSGEVHRRIEAWRDDLLQGLAMIEASLDFVDEELPDDLTQDILTPLQRVLSSIERELKGKAAAEMVRDGFEIALMGRVNAGKSSLLNYLAGREAAITSDIAGTTRDVIEVRMDINGFAVTLIDTAGLRAATDSIEARGIEKGLERAAAADLRIYLKSAPEEEIELPFVPEIVTLSKSDLLDVPGISSVTGEGIDQLISDVDAHLQTLTKASSIFSRSRHFDKLQRAQSALRDSVDALSERSAGFELISEELRTTIFALDGIIGRIEVEDVLGRIFSSFCIGK